MNLPSQSSFGTFVGAFRTRSDLGMAERIADERSLLLEPVYCRTVSRLVRSLLPWSSTWISKAEALNRATLAADAPGLPWSGPFGVYRHYGDWSVRSSIDVRGGNVAVLIDGATGEVKRVLGPTPR